MDYEIFLGLKPNHYFVNLNSDICPVYQLQLEVSLSFDWNHFQANYKSHKSILKIQFADHLHNLIDQYIYNFTFSPCNEIIVGGLCSII